MNFETFMKCQESIYKGGPCLSCGVKWDGTALDHKPDCEYLNVLDEIEFEELLNEVRE